MRPDASRATSACNVCGETRRVLAQIKPHGAEAEHLRGEPQRAHEILGEAEAAAFGQSLLGHREIGDQFVGAGVIAAPTIGTPSKRASVALILPCAQNRNWR